MIIFLYIKIKDEEIRTSLNYALSMLGEDPYELLLVLLLMPVNWLLEGLKWKKLCAPIINLSFKNAFKGVLAGISVAFVTPHGWGDYVARIGLIDNAERMRLIGGLMFGRLTQLLMTLTFGAIGLFMYLDKWSVLNFWYLGLFTVIFLFTFFNKTILRRLKPYLFKVKKYFQIIEDYDMRTIYTVLLYSFLRYLVFGFQFLMIMFIFDIDLSIKTLIGGTTWIFLVKSIVPSFNFLSDLGIREVSAILFFEHYLTDMSPVVMATMLIWLINILLPAILGSLFIFSIKAFR